MSENNRASDQRTRIVRPRTVPEAEVSSLADLELKDLEDPQESAQQVPAGSAESPETSEAPTRPYEFFEDLPEEVRTEFIKLADGRDELHRFFQRKGCSAHDAEELTCEVHQALIVKLMDGVPVGDMRAYAYGIARYKLLEIWKRKKAKVQQVLTDNIELFQDEAAVVQWEGFNDSLQFRELLKQCTQTLSPYQITVFYLYSILDVPYDVISALLDRTPGALRVCHKQAVDKIKANAIALADLRLATRHSSYSEQDTRKKPKEPKKTAKRSEPRK